MLSERDVQIEVWGPAGLDIGLLSRSANLAHSFVPGRGLSLFLSAGPGSIGIGRGL